MTRQEITLNKELREMEKLEGKRERLQKKIEKTIAKMTKEGVAHYTKEMFINEKDELSLNQYNILFTWFGILDIDMPDLLGKIEKCERRIAKAETAVAEIKEEKEKLEKMEEIENQKTFIAQAKKDGLKIEEYNSVYTVGYTKSGKRFVIMANNGMAERSRYCFSLDIAGETVFTSGTFRTAYAYLINR